jgi:hypothetical protein
VLAGLDLDACQAAATEALRATTSAEALAIARSHFPAPPRP